ETDFCSCWGCVWCSAHLLHNSCSVSTLLVRIDGNMTCAITSMGQHRCTNPVSIIFANYGHLLCAISAEPLLRHKFWLIIDCSMTNTSIQSWPSVTVTCARECSILK